MASLVKRNGTYYVQWYVGKAIKRRSLRTASRQLAKAKLAKFEAAQVEGVDNPLPTRTQIADIVGAYVDHIRTVKTAKSAQTDIYYLRETFGPVCEQLKITSRRVSPKARKRPEIAAEAQGTPQPRIEAPCLEAVTTAQISDFIGQLVRRRGLAPKTANRYREILCRLFNWAMNQRGIRMPGGHNPAAKVERYREKRGPIRYLTLDQIDEQLHALRFKPQLQTMVATLIYAGLRRGELLWLTTDDVDLRRGVIHIRPKAHNGETWQGKTAGSVRAVPISTSLRQHLARYSVRPTDGQWFFPSPQAARYDEDNFSRDLRAANKEVNLLWSCLDFRHTFGSHLAQKGVSLYKIATLMGNSPEICRRHYAALVPEAMSDEVDFSQAARSTLVQTA